MKINDINNKVELVAKIINQVNALNKKIKKFDTNSIETHKEYRENMLGEMVHFSDSGTITKSKKFYEGKSVIELQKILSVTHKINNHNTLGTVHKYETTVTNNVKRIQDYVKGYLLSNGYSMQEVLDIINDKRFLTNLIDEFNNSSKKIDSDQKIDKIALSYKEDFIDDKTINKTLNNIKSTENALNNIAEYDRNVRELMEQNRNNNKR